MSGASSIRQAAFDWRHQRGLDGSHCTVDSGTGSSSSSTTAGSPAPRCPLRQRQQHPSHKALSPVVNVAILAVAGLVLVDQILHEVQSHHALGGSCQRPRKPAQHPTRQAGAVSGASSGGSCSWERGCRWCGWMRVR